MRRSIRVKSPKLIANTVRLLGNVTIGARTKIHDWSILGFPNRNRRLISKQSKRVVRIGDRCIIYPWCLIYEGASLHNKVEVHEHCMIGSLTKIGEKSMILYGAQVHDNVRIGRECIIAGFVADNCVVGDGCSVFGTLIHRYDYPGRKLWDRTDELGPTLGKGVVVGWGAVIVGPVKIGDEAWIAPNSIVKENVSARVRYARR